MARKSNITVTSRRSFFGAVTALIAGATARLRGADPVVCRVTSREIRPQGGTIRHGKFVADPNAPNYEIHTVGEVTERQIDDAIEEMSAIWGRKRYPTRTMYFDLSKDN